MGRETLLVWGFHDGDRETNCFNLMRGWTCIGPVSWQVGEWNGVDCKITLRCAFPSAVNHGDSPRRAAVIFPVVAAIRAAAADGGGGRTAVCYGNGAMNNYENNPEKDENRDPITGEPGSHPLGTGVGTAGGALTGAAIGAVGGPIGALVGGVIGGIAGAAAGHAVAEEIDPTAENAYWNQNFRNEPYYEKDHDFNDYGPAYRLGYDNRGRQPGRTYEQAESELEGKWNDVKDQSRLGWENARHAVRAGWHRVERAMPGDADGDGR